MSFCHPCPLNSARTAASLGTNVTECLCLVNSYSLAGPGHPCLPCVFGGECEGGTLVPYPAEGFWGDKNCEVFGGSQHCPGEFEFLECEDTNCMGGARSRYRSTDTGLASAPN
eukprot:3940919-Rhodomonas_salina.3